MSEPVSYYLWVKQNGEGCDYTIGCGEKLISLGEAKTAGDLNEMIIEELEYHGIHPESENSAKEMMILQCVEKLDPDDWDYREYEDDEDVEDEHTAERRRKYEELKKEFG